MKRQDIELKIAELEIKAGAIEARHESELAPTYKAIEKLRGELRRLVVAAEKAREYRLKSRWTGKTPNSPEEYVSWLCDSKRAAREFGENPASAQPSKQVRKFGFGVRVFSASRYSEKFYTAFDAAGHIVGCLKVYPSQHPGDNTYVPLFVVRGKKVDIHPYGTVKPVQTWISAMEDGVHAVGLKYKESK